MLEGYTENLVSGRKPRKIGKRTSTEKRGSDTKTFSWKERDCASKARDERENVRKILDWKVGNGSGRVASLVIKTVSRGVRRRHWGPEKLEAQVKPTEDRASRYYMER